MAENITRRQFFSGISALALSCAFAGSLSGCSHEEYPTLLILEDYDEKTGVGILAHSDEIRSLGYARVSVKKEHKTNYDTTRALRLNEEDIKSDLNSLQEEFDSCNKDELEYAKAIIRTENGFESLFVDHIEIHNDKKKLSIYKDGLGVARNIDVLDCLIIGQNEKVYIDPLVANEYELQDKTKEITGKELVKIK